MAKKSHFNIVTANHLLEGESIFLSENGWTTNHRHARIAAGPDEASALESLAREDEARNQVVGVYLVGVELDESGHPEPVHYREKMRVRARPSFWPDPETPRHNTARRSVRGFEEVTHVSV